MSTLQKLEVSVWRMERGAGGGWGCELRRAGRRRMSGGGRCSVLPLFLDDVWEWQR